MVDRRVALWHCSNGIAWVELWCDDGRYYCQGKHGGQSLGSIENDDIALAQMRELIDAGSFDPPAITWKSVNLVNGNE
jgi:hypothetical protein